jgi:hypothetical protein
MMRSWRSFPDVKRSPDDDWNKPLFSQAGRVSGRRKYRGGQNLLIIIAAVMRMRS